MVDRADALSPRGAARTDGPATSAGWLASNPRAVLVVIAGLELAWLAWFLIVPLPNAQNVAVRRGIQPDVPSLVLRRGVLLLETFPEVVPGTSFRESLLGGGLAELSHVENLPQRLPILLAAALIAAAAIGLGGTAIALLGIRHRLRFVEWLALAYGLGAALLGVLTLVVGRMGWLAPGFIRIGLAGLAGLTLFSIIPMRGRAGIKAGDCDGQAPDVSSPAAAEPSTGRKGDPLAWLFLLVIAPFVVITLLGSMLPAADFDVLEYHLQGPKEYYQAGRIQFLPHNVYTNMPFDVEMLHLLGMEVMGDWWWGALPGQLLVALFGPATAVLIYSTAARVSPRAGWIAALAYVSTPWVYRFGVIAYVEGPLCFYHAALVWAWLWRPAAEDGPGRTWMLVGLLAGGAMGCKYTALVSAVVPFGALAIVDCWRGRSARPLLAYGLGWAIIMAPWLVKNLNDTGDPVYPLGYRVFHGRPWDEARQAQWQKVHGPRDRSWKELAGSIVDVAGRSDWQSSLYVALAPLAWLRAGSRRTAWILGSYIAYLFFTWWLFTHRLDRFWLPLLPAAAVLAGLGAEWSRLPSWRALLAALLAVAIVTNLSYDSSALAGLNEWTSDLNVQRRDVPRRLNRALALLDARVPADARVLMVGQAAVFHFSHAIVYNTVFNPEQIEELARGKDSAAFQRALRDRKLTHIYVDWKEIERHRQPGGYGFTDFVTPARFARWVADGVLDHAVSYGADQELYRIR